MCPECERLPLVTRLYYNGAYIWRVRDGVTTVMCDTEQKAARLAANIARQRMLSGL